MAESKVRVGNIRQVSGEVIIAGGDVVKGYTAEEVSRLLKQIESTFQPKAFDGTSPYKGLGVFEEEDAELFFGRERLVDDLLGRVKESRTVFITGPSGSGKSSLVRAGVLPACRSGRIKTLRSKRWLYETIKPGRDPLEALALVFSRLKTPELADYFRNHIDQTSILNACAESVLTSGRADQRFVLFIDQFEEIFTQISKEEERVQFLNVLTDAIAVENGRVTLLFAMRSEFISNCAVYPALNELLNQEFVQIGSMQPDELVSAIAQPALRVGLRIDPDLIAQIINDMEGEPGTLPLMQFALKDLFDNEQAKGGLIALTRQAYLDRGGIHKSLERHADEAFTRLSTNEQELARTIFSGLIEIGSGAPDTGRTAIFEELVPADQKAADVEATLRKLEDARLLTTDEVGGQDQVTIAHERLIQAWPWLKRLVDENRDVIALQNQIAEHAQEWVKHGRDPSYLYTGARLANAHEQLKARKLVLSGLAREYVQAGEARKLRGQIALLLGVFTIFAALVLAVIVFSNQARENAQLAKEAQRQTEIALARQFIAQTQLMPQDKTDLALLLSVEAYKLDDTLDARSNLLSTLQCCYGSLVSLLSGHDDSVWDVAFSPDGKLLASAGDDGSIIIRATDNHRQITRLNNPESSANIYTIAFSPTDPILAAGDATGAITLYNTETWKAFPEPLRGHDQDAGVLSLKFSSDGALLVSGGIDGKVLIWDMVHRTLSQTLTGPTHWVWDVAISADQGTVVAVGRDRKLHVWSLDPNAAVQSVIADANVFVSAEFDDNASPPLLVTGDTNGGVVIWDLGPWQKDGSPPNQSNRLQVGPASTTTVWGLALIPGSEHSFITGRENGLVNRNLLMLGDEIGQATLQPESLGMTVNTAGLFRMAVSPDGKLVAAAGRDGLVSLWNTYEVSNVIWHTGEVINAQALSGEASIAMSVDENGELQRWDYTKREIVDGLTLATSQITQSAINLDGTNVVTGYADGKLILWDGGDGKELSARAIHSDPITSVVFSPDGRLLASSDTKGHVILWNVSDDHQLKASAYFTDPRQSAVQTLLFSPDGKTLIGGGCANRIGGDCGRGGMYVWDLRLHVQQRWAGTSGYAWSLALNPDNPDELAVGTRDGTISIWNLREQKSRLTIRLGKGDITALAFSPDGTLLAVGAESYKVFIYDAGTGLLYGQAFREHDGKVSSLAFAENGNVLLSASLDGTVVIHDMQPEHWQARACAIANRNLTRAEWKKYIGEALDYQKICPDFELDP